MHKKRTITLLLLMALALGLLAGCGGTQPAASSAPAEPTAVPSEPTATPAPAEAVAEAAAPETGSHLAPDAFYISVEPIGHWHVFATKKLLFTVTETASNAGKTGLNLTVQIAQPGSSSTSERSVEQEQIVDEEDGIYSLDYTAANIGGYGLVARFNYEGQEFVSAPVAFEVAKDGEEGIRIEAQDTAYVYQIRYHWAPGHIHANDDEAVKLVFEIMRGIPEGDAIDWEKPWQNAFDHTVDAENPVVRVESEDGAVADELRAVYKGKGIYEAERIFPVAEVGEGGDYNVRFVFTDPHNGAEVTHVEPYRLHASSPH